MNILCCHTDWITNACTIFAGVCSSIIAILVWKQQKRLQEIQFQHEEERTTLLNQQNELQKQLVLYNKRTEQKEYLNYLEEVQSISFGLPDFVVAAFCSIGGPSRMNIMEEAKSNLSKIEILQSRLDNINPSLMAFVGCQTTDNRIYNLIHQADLLSKLTLDLFKVFPSTEQQNNTKYHTTIVSMLKAISPQDAALKDNIADDDILSLHLKLQCKLNAIIEGDQWYHEFLQQIIDLTKPEQLPQPLFPNCISDYYKYYGEVFGKGGLSNILEQESYKSNL